MQTQALVAVRHLVECTLAGAHAEAQHGGVVVGGRAGQAAGERRPPAAQLRRAAAERRHPEPLGPRVQALAVPRQIYYASTVRSSM